MAKSSSDETPSLLPNTLSGMIRIALKDENRAFKSSEYYIDMTAWHLPPGFGPYKNRDICRVCLSGAVMAGTLELPRTESETPSSLLPDDEANRLGSLDYIRTGDVFEALVNGRFTNRWNAVEVGTEIKEAIGKPPIYRSQRIKPEKRRDWRKWMFRCAKELEARGL